MECKEKATEGYGGGREGGAVMGRGKLTRQNGRLMGAKPCLLGLFYPPCLVLLSKFGTRECLNNKISVLKSYLRLKKKKGVHIYLGIKEILLDIIIN